MDRRATPQWAFTREDGRFTLRDADSIRYAYFPLVNPAGMMSCVTPNLQGDAKSGQNAFLLTPASVEDLHEGRFGRNFWLRINGAHTWSATGNSAAQRATKFTGQAAESVTVEAGFLWHRVTRRHDQLGVEAEITSFVPAGGRHVELMEVVIRNIGREPLELVPTAAIPLYGRSADSIRDHRHVTSLLHRIETTAQGIVVTPTLSFDERGHRLNQRSYALWGLDHEHRPPVTFFPVLEDFAGEAGSLDWPEAVVCNRPGTARSGSTVDGFEALGGLRFAGMTLGPKQEARYRLVLSIHATGDHAADMVYLTQDAFAAAFEETQSYWSSELDGLIVHTGDGQFNQWFRWVTLQPILRRIFGCSFLPYHDYGRGGRGWRDLWQDCMGLLLLGQHNVRDLLKNNFAGVRMDGSNATIIGREPGEFVADRNDIPRVWMDHGVWPLLTTKLYLDISGDLSFLLEEQVYFKDKHARRCTAHDPEWDHDHGTSLKTQQGTPYRGSILEHLIVQNITPFFNVGEHNHILLEGGDWNDGMSMARTKGESVAFTAMYGGNLLELGRLLQALERRLGKTEIKLAEELTMLLDTMGSAVEYSCVQAKRTLLERYYDCCSNSLSGTQVCLPIAEVAEDLSRKGEWILEHLRHNEWVEDDQGHGWFNGYYDELGRRLEGDHAGGVRMTLTGQVFAMMSGAASQQQAREMVRTAAKYLWDERVGGYRLNTDFGEVLPDMGHCFGFAYGHKENGAMFCHMAVMFAYALYARGLVHEGHRILDGIYRQCMDFERSKVLPGIPEYFNQRGRGMYPYLTGSASWYIYTLLTQAFGVRGVLGDLCIRPALTTGQFNQDGEASVTTVFADRTVRVRFCNSQRRDYPAYAVTKISIAGHEVACDRSEHGMIVPREAIECLDPGQIHELTVTLE